MDDQFEVPEGCMVAPGQNVEVRIIGDERVSAEVEACVFGVGGDRSYLLTWLNYMGQGQRMTFTDHSLTFFGTPRLVRISEIPVPA